MTTDQINIDDLRERAKTMHARALMHHYGVTGGKMHRMLKKYGIKAATYVRTDRAYSSRYADLPEKIGTMTRSEMAVHYGCTLKTLHSVLHRRGIRVSSIPLGEASKTPVSLRMDNDAEYGSAALLKALAKYHVKHGNPEPYWKSLLGEAA